MYGISVALSLSCTHTHTHTGASTHRNARLQAALTHVRVCVRACVRSVASPLQQKQLIWNVSFFAVYVFTFNSCYYLPARRHR